MARDKIIKTSQVGGIYYDLILCGRERVYLFQHNDQDNYPCDHDGMDATNEVDAIVEFDVKIELFHCQDRGPYRDWEAQALYDEMHGTINGQDPSVVAYEEAFPYGE